MNPYTVILRHPDWVGADDNGWAGTALRHVLADTPDAATTDAQRLELQASMCMDADPEDWAVVGVFAGHLQDLHTP